VDMQLYKRGSVKVMETLREFSEAVEVVGLDEAYVDLSASPVPQSRAQEIKRRIREVTYLVCSIGMAPNKLMAKIASDLDKPDGFFVLDHDNWLATVGEKPAKLLPGVGPRTDERLRSIGIETVGQLAEADSSLLGATFGPRHGLDLRERANGVGSTDLNLEPKRKSESRETTFPQDVTAREVLHETVERLARSVCESLGSNGKRGRTVTLKIRLQPFKTYTRSRTLPEATCDAGLVVTTARELLERFDPQAPVRLVGVGVAGLVSDEAPQHQPGQLAV
jgi:DNA polymerase-4